MVYFKTISKSKRKLTDPINRLTQRDLLNYFAKNAQRIQEKENDFEGACDALADELIDQLITYSTQSNGIDNALFYSLMKELSTFSLEIFEKLRVIDTITQIIVSSDPLSGEDLKQLMIAALSSETYRNNDEDRAQNITSIIGELLNILSPVLTKESIESLLTHQGLRALPDHTDPNHPHDHWNKIFDWHQIQIKYALTALTHPSDTEILQYFDQEKDKIVEDDRSEIPYVKINYLYMHFKNQLSRVAATEIEPIMLMIDIRNTDHGKINIKDYKALSLGYLLRAINHSNIADKPRIYQLIQETQLLSSSTTLDELLTLCDQNNERYKLSILDNEALKEIITICQKVL